MKLFRCASCGKEYYWPPLDYGSDAPWREMGVSPDEFDRRVHLGRDDCIVDDEHFFIRGNIDIPIIDRSEIFAWGVWCSVSRKSYDRICAIWQDRNRFKEPPFFGWLSTQLPCYSIPTVPVKTRVHLREIGRTPFIEVDSNHPLGREQQDGITIDRIIEFARTIFGDNAKPGCFGCT